VARDAYDIEQLITIAMDCGFAIHRAIGLLMNFGDAMMRDGISRVINDPSDYIAPAKNKRVPNA
jgi:hypothetical protein